MKIYCQIKTETKKRIKVKIVKAPLVNSVDFKRVVLNRSRAVVL